MEKKLEQKDLNHSLKLIAKSSLFVFIGLFLSKILAYPYKMIIARYFGPEVYGLFSLATIIFLIFVSFSSLGLNQGLLRFISFYRGKNNIKKIKYLLKYVIIILCFSSIFSAVLLYSFSEFISVNIFHNLDLTIFLKIISIAIPFYILGYTFLSIIQAFERTGAYSFILDFSQIFIKLSTLILLIFIGLKTNAIILSYSLGIFGIFLISYFYCKYKISEVFGKVKLKKQIKKEIRKEIFSYSWPLVFLSILYVILPYTDSFIIGYFKTVSDVGIYNVAFVISELVVLTPLLFIRLFFPLITKEFSRKNFKVIQELSKQVEKWILIINLPLFLIIVLFPGAFINILFGSKYLAGANALRFLVAGTFLYSLTIISHNLISMAGKTKLILINIIAASLFNLILNIILIPKYSINGAAFSTMITTFLLAIAFFIEVKYCISIIPLRRKMLRVLFSIIPPTLLLIYIRQFIPINLFTLILQSSLFILSYTLMIFITKSLDKNDLMILKTIKRKIIQ